MVSKKIRFEVFKRDGFTCQYCGRTPPAVVLELDHIIPKGEGGPESIDNYITACFDCNRGKGKGKLDVIPPQGNEKLKLLKEKRAQLKAFNRLIEKQEAELDYDIAEVIHVFHINFPESLPTERFSSVTIKRFVNLLPLIKVKDAMSLACSTKSDDPEAALRYFCGICWNWIKKPETRNW
jgi:hypothetical protein